MSTDAATRAKVIRSKARIFIMWREGRSVNWDCTAEDLARVAGVSVHYARQVARERGWPIQDDLTGKRKRRAARETDGPLPVDLSMMIGA